MTIELTITEKNAPAASEHLCACGDACACGASCSCPSV